MTRYNKLKAGEQKNRVVSVWFKKDEHNKVKAEAKKQKKKVGPMIRDWSLEKL